MEPLVYNIAYSRDACAEAVCESVSGALWLAGQLPSPMPALEAWHSRFRAASQSRLVRRAATRHCALLAGGLSELLLHLRALIHEHNVVYICLCLGASYRKPRMALLIDLSNGNPACVAPCADGLTHPRAEACPSDGEDTAAESTCVDPRAPSRPPAPPSSRVPPHALLVRPVHDIPPPDVPQPPAVLDAVRRKALRHLVSHADALLGHRGAPGFDLPMFGGVVHPAPSATAPATEPAHFSAPLPPPTRIHVFVLVEEVEEEEEDERGAEAGAKGVAPVDCAPSLHPPDVSALPAPVTARGALATPWQHRHGFVLPASRSGRGRRAPAESAWPNATLRILWAAAGGNTAKAMHAREAGDVARCSREEASELRLGRSGAGGSARRPSSHDGGAGGPARGGAGLRRLVWVSWAGSRLHGFAGGLPELPPVG